MILDKVKILPSSTSQHKIAENYASQNQRWGNYSKREDILCGNFNSTQTGNQKLKQDGKDPKVNEALREWFY